MPDYQWDYGILSKHQNITWEIIQSNPDTAWNTLIASMNPNINWDTIQHNPSVRWSSYLFSTNQNVTYDIVLNNLWREWSPVHLLRNGMETDKNNYIRKCFQKHFMSCGIAEELISVVWNPRNFEKFKYLDPETFGEEDF